jgi:hypothetical protein
MSAFDAAIIRLDDSLRTSDPKKLRQFKWRRNFSPSVAAIIPFARPIPD